MKHRESQFQDEVCVAAAAIDLNARANRVRASVLRRDVLDDEPPDVRPAFRGLNVMP
jgi:hypothetical protein